MVRTIGPVVVAVVAGAACAPPPRVAPAPAAQVAPPRVEPASHVEPVLERALLGLDQLVTSASFAHVGLEVPDLGGPAAALPPEYAVEIRDAFTALVRAVARWGGPLADQPTDFELSGLGRELSDAFERAGADYYIEVEVERDPPEPPDGVADPVLVVRAYRIERRTTLVAGAHRVRALDVRLLGTGYQPALGLFDGRSLVLVDNVESTAELMLVPVLASGGAFPMAWSDDRVAHELEAAASGAIRRELRGVLGGDAALGARVGTLLARREAIAWDDPELERKLAPINARLRAIDASDRIVHRVAAALAIGVRLHEAQHAFDAERTVPLVCPPALQRAIAELGPAGSEPHATLELSAFLAELAGDEPVPQASLWSIARFAFVNPGDLADAAEADYIASSVIVIESIARQLGAAGDQPVVHDGAVDRDRLAALVLRAADASAGELHRAAAAAWTELFGEPFQPVGLTE